MIPVERKHVLLSQKVFIKAFFISHKVFIKSRFAKVNPRKNPSTYPLLLPTSTGADDPRRAEARPPPGRPVHLEPSTLNPQPSTLNPQPSTLNPQPSTLNPQP